MNPFECCAFPVQQPRFLPPFFLPKGKINWPGSLQISFLTFFSYTNHRHTWTTPDSIVSPAVYLHLRHDGDLPGSTLTFPITDRQTELMPQMFPYITDDLKGRVSRSVCKCNIQTGPCRWRFLLYMAIFCFFRKILQIIPLTSASHRWTNQSV